jgi:hypothetical protein
MDARENRLRAWAMDQPERIPVKFGLWGSALRQENYDQERLWELIDAFPVIAQGLWRPDSYPVRFAPIATVGQRYTDPWGCVWETAEEGATGQVVESPLKDWKQFEHFSPPRPQTTDGRKAVNWFAVVQAAREKKDRGELARLSLPHGHTFLRLCDLRGYENLLFDMVDEVPELDRLVEMVRQFNLAVVEIMLQAQPDVLAYPEDLGMQVGPMIGPEQFHRYIAPSYRSILAPAREAGALIHMHSDGDIRSLLDSLIDCGVQVINCQEDAVGLDWLVAEAKGRVAIDLCLSARLIAFGEPGRIKDYVWRCADELSTPRGGLSLGGQLPPGVPWENIRALYEVLQEVNDTPLPSPGL